MSGVNEEPYFLAQSAISQLKGAIYLVLKQAPPAGLKNSEIGRMLGIYKGHIEHEGHIPRTLLTIMETEEVVIQDKDTKLWSLRKF